MRTAISMNTQATLRMIALNAVRRFDANRLQEKTFHKNIFITEQTDASVS